MSPYELLDALNAAAAKVGVRLLYSKTIADTSRTSALRFRLGLQEDRKFQAYSYQGRRVAAVCWHGHRDFFRALFSSPSDVKIQSAYIRNGAIGGERWYTAENFERVFPATDKNVGSIMQPMLASEGCKCHE